MKCTYVHDLARHTRGENNMHQTSIWRINKFDIKTLLVI